MVIFLIIIGVVAIAIYVACKSSAWCKPSVNMTNSSISSHPANAFTSGDTVDSDKPTNAQGSTSSVNPDCWIPQTTSISVAGYTITEGMFYVGNDLKSVNGYNDIEPALIDPSLPINHDNPDIEGKKMSYWPSYSAITPESRAAYLEWLSGGRRDPDANIGYVFMFFYGLERRVIFDAQTSEEARCEVDVILTEVKRLISIYGDKSSSFRNYASDFVDILSIKYADDKVYRSLPAIRPRGYELPINIKIGLGQIALDEIPLSPEWAFVWAVSDPLTYLKTPAQRCKSEFEALFKLRYRKKYGDGIVLKIRSRMLEIKYHAASSSFTGLTIAIKGLPDVFSYAEPINTLRMIANSCSDELDAYSRFLGRNPDKVGSIEAVSLLPRELFSDSDNEEIASYRRQINSMVGDRGCSVFDLNGVIDDAPFKYSLSITKKEFHALGVLLENIGIGIEPDVRFGGAIPANGKVALFKSGNITKTPSDSYTSASIIVYLCVAVANADNAITPDEEQTINHIIESFSDITEDERMRLRANFEWLKTSGTSLTSLKRRITDLPTETKNLIAEHIVRVANADGNVSPDEIRILRKTYDLLGFETRQLFSNIHQATTTPVTVQHAESASVAFTIPSPPADTIKKSGTSLRLDMAEIRRKEAESQKLKELLDSVFANEETEIRVVSHSDNAEAVVSIMNLDALHSGLVRHLIQKESWTRSELETIASEKRFLIDGAIDVINEASFDEYGDALIEGDDPVEINPAVAKEILK